MEDKYLILIPNMWIWENPEGYYLFKEDPSQPYFLNEDAFLILTLIDSQKINRYSRDS